MRAVYYNLYDYGRKVGTHTPVELQAMLHCSRSIPCEYAADGKTYHGRDTFERIEPPAGNEDIATRWEQATRRLRTSGYDLGKIKIMLGEGEANGQN